MSAGMNHTVHTAGVHRMVHSAGSIGFENQEGDDTTVSGIRSASRGRGLTLPFE